MGKSKSIINKMNQTSKLAIVVFSILSMAVNGYSQGEAQPFTLRSSIEYSVKNNPTSTIYNNQAEISRIENKID